MREGWGADADLSRAGTPGGAMARAMGTSVVVAPRGDKMTRSATVTARARSPRRRRLAARPGALFRRALGTGQVERGIDQRDMRERLREIAELASQPRIVFLGQQAAVVGQGQQPLAQRAA